MKNEQHCVSRTTRSAASAASSGLRRKQDPGRQRTEPLDRPDRSREQPVELGDPERSLSRGQRAGLRCLAQVDVHVSTVNPYVGTDNQSDAAAVQCPPAPSTRSEGHGGAPLGCEPCRCRSNLTMPPSAFSTGWPGSTPRRWPMPARAAARAPGRATAGPPRATDGRPRADRRRPRRPDADAGRAAAQPARRRPGGGGRASSIAVAGELFAHRGAAPRGDRDRDRRPVPGQSYVRPPVPPGVRPRRGPDGRPAPGRPRHPGTGPIGGVEVRPGDLVLGDDDGIVVGSDAEVWRCWRPPKGSSAAEAYMQAAIAGGSAVRQPQLRRAPRAPAGGEDSRLAFS